METANASKRAASEGAKQTVEGFGTPKTLSSERSFIKVGHSGSSERSRHSLRGPDGKFTSRTSEKQEKTTSLASEREKIQKSSRASSRASSSHSLKSIPEDTNTKAQFFDIGLSPQQAVPDDDDIYASFDDAAGLLMDLDDALQNLDTANDFRVNTDLLLDSITPPQLHLQGQDTAVATTEQSADLSHHISEPKGFPQFPDFFEIKFRKFMRSPRP